MYEITQNLCCKVRKMFAFKFKNALEQILKKIPCFKILTKQSHGDLLWDVIIIHKTTNNMEFQPEKFESLISRYLKDCMFSACVCAWICLHACFLTYALIYWSQYIAMCIHLLASILIQIPIKVVFNFRLLSMWQQVLSIIWAHHGNIVHHLFASRFF